MKKYITLLLVACATLMISGCEMIDLDGNGKFDPVAYMEGIDINVSLVAEDGTVYTVAVDEYGKKLIGQYIQAKTGYLFDVAPDGGITVTDPTNGLSINLARNQEG